MNHRISFLVEPDKEPKALNILYKWHIEFDAVSAVVDGKSMVRFSAVIEDELYFLQATAEVLDMLHEGDGVGAIDLHVEQIMD